MATKCVTRCLISTIIYPQQLKPEMAGITFEGVEEREPEGDLDFDLGCGDFDPRFCGPSSASNRWPERRGLASSIIGSRSGPTSSGSIHSSPVGWDWGATQRK